MLLHSMKQEPQKEIHNGIARMLMVQAVNMFLLILFLSCAQKKHHMVLPFRLLGGRGVGGVRFTTLGCSGCHNVAQHLPIQIKTMVVPCRFLWVGRGLRLTTVVGSDSYNVSSHTVLIMCQKTTLHGSTF